MEFPHLSQLCLQTVPKLTPFCSKTVTKAGYNVSHKLLIEFWLFPSPDLANIRALSLNRECWSGRGWELTPFFHCVYERQQESA
jgi:hypothetical protein